MSSALLPVYPLRVTPELVFLASRRNWKHGKGTPIVVIGGLHVAWVFRVALWAGPNDENTRLL